MPDPATGPRRFATFVVAASLLAAAANLAGAVSVPAVSQPVRLHDSGALGDLVRSQNLNIDQAYGVYGELRELSGAGATIAVSNPLVLDPYVLEHLSLLRVTTDVTLPRRIGATEALRLDELAIAEGITDVLSRGRSLPFVIVSSEDGPTDLLVLRARGLVAVAARSDWLRVIGSGP